LAIFFLELLEPSSVLKVAETELLIVFVGFVKPFPQLLLRLPSPLILFCQPLFELANL
jgi:hypothetical protein